MVGSDTSVLQGKYPAKAHAKRVADYIRRKCPGVNGVLYLEAQAVQNLEDCDQAQPFRQRRFFFYLTGCELADSHLIYDMDTARSTLLIPPVEPDDVLWCGLPMTTEEAQSRYDVDEVRLATEGEVNSALVQMANQRPGRSTVFAMAGQVSAKITFSPFGEINLTALREAAESCRAVKDDYEIALLRKANQMSAVAHHAVLQSMARCRNESEVMAVYLERCVGQGAKNQAYDPIVASGRGAATLHYVANDACLDGKLNLLLDAGVEWNCYAADITRTIPISGKFSKESRAIYDIVLQMQTECLAMMKEGVVWDDVQILAHKIAIDGLLGLGILHGASADELLERRTSVAFFPHGLGHYLGMDTHDVGGQANYGDSDPLFRWLRKRGPLPAGSVITVEPGLYFCRFIIEPYLRDPVQSRYIDAKVLDRYWDVGGVRIEDDVVVTATGVDNLTTVVKDPDELERMMSAGEEAVRNM